MTVEDIKTLLNEVAARYPSFVKGVGASQKRGVVEAWVEDLKHYNLSQAREALKEYVIQNQRGFAPTTGQLIKLMPEEYENVDANDFFKGNVNCPFCSDSGWWLSEAEVENGYTTTVARPCKECRPELYNRWERDFKGKDRGSTAWTIDDGKIRLMRY